VALAPRFYQVASLETLAERGLTRAEILAPGASVADPPLGFGQTDLADCAIDQQPGGLDWRSLPGGIPIGPIVRYTFDDATVHGPEGIVTVGRYVVEPTLDHVWPPRAGAWRDGALWLLHNQFTTARLAEAEHLLHCNCRNYYHWLLDGVGRWSVGPTAPYPCLLPWSGAPFQRTGLALLPGLPARAFMLSPGQAVQVGRLHWTASLTGAGTQFHPALRRMGAAMRTSVVAATPPALDTPSALYVCRDDASNRPLRNEAAVARLCADRGYHVIRLAKLSVMQQVALYAGAQRIVAPHGAGLANLLFTQAGTALLELQMDRYVNWCFRRLAATMEVRYGCLVGQAELGEGSVHARGWSLDLDRLEAALDEPGFGPDV